MRVDRNGARALIVVDVQNDFCANGALAVPDGDAVVAPINEMMAHFDNVILTQDWHPPAHSSFATSHPGSAPFSTVQAFYGTQVLWPDHCVQGTKGAEFHDALNQNAARLVIRKGTNPEIDSYSAFFENDRQSATGLAGYLRELGVDRLVLAGLATDFCVAYSALDAARLGFQTELVLDGSRAIDLDGSLEHARSEMSANGVRFIACSDVIG